MPERRFSVKWYGGGEDGGGKLKQVEYRDSREARRYWLKHQFYHPTNHRRVGWIEGDSFYLHPGRTYTAIRYYLADTKAASAPLPPLRHLVTELSKRGYLRGREPRKYRGRLYSVLHLPASCVVPES